MNWVLILVIAIFAGYTLAGFSKGFLKIVYSLVSWIVILVVVITATPYIENYLKNNTGIYNKVVAYCEETIREQAQQQLTESGEEAAEALSENELFSVIADKIPKELLEKLKIQATELTDELMNSQGLYNKAAVAMAELLIRGVSTFVAIILGIIISVMISALLGFVSHLPIIGFADRILGLAAGAVNGLLIVWIAFYLVAVLCTTKWGSIVIAQIYENEMLLYLYENNIVLALLT